MQPFVTKRLTDRADHLVNNPGPENLTWPNLKRDNKESPVSGLRQIMSGNLAIRGSYARQSVGIRPSAVWRRQLLRTRHVRFSGASAVPLTLQRPHAASAAASRRPGPGLSPIAFATGRWVRFPRNKPFLANGSGQRRPDIALARESATLIPCFGVDRFAGFIRRTALLTTQFRFASPDTAVAFAGIPVCRNH
jgi:hypothetical protein